MSELIDHLAELTGFRDRDVLDVTLVGSLREILHPRSVAIYRVTGDPGEERWTTRARLGASDAVAAADPAWADPQTLPRLALFPSRVRALAGEAVVASGADESTHSTFPVESDKGVVGVLEIETEAPLPDESARLVSSVLRIYRNFQCLLDYSERDTLTGLLNRKTFDDSFLKLTGAPLAARATAAATDEAVPPLLHWLSVIDVDHFKRVNDNHGHLIGDEVLLLLSRLMNSSFRFHDRLYRFGGEEFVVLMRCPDEEDARQVLERMRANTAAYRFPQVGTITVSIGFTQVVQGDSPSAAFERADRAVYLAKEQGRNCVRSHADLVASRGREDAPRTGDVELF